MVTTSPTKSNTRVLCIDWMRALSVLIMMVAHSLIFLSPEHDHDKAREYFNEMDGLPGPTFILASGFSLALVTAREAGDATRRRARARKSLLRIGQVFLTSLLLRHIMWDTFRHPERFKWLDVLSCIGLMLLILWAILFLLPAAMRWPAILLLMLTCFFVAPWVDAPRTFGPFTTLLNNGPYHDTWPLVPWAGYGFLGALIGRATGRSSKPRVTLALAFVLVLIGGAAVNAYAGQLVNRIDASVNAFNLVNAGARLWRISIAGLVLLGAESLGVTLERWPGSIVGLVSRQALLAYVTHLLLIFGYWRIQPLNRFLNHVDWPGYAALATVVVAGTVTTCVIVDRYQSRRA